MHSRQQVTHEMARRHSLLFEKSSYQLAEVVSSSKPVIFDAELSAHGQQKHKESIAFIRKKQHDLPVFFSRSFLERPRVSTEETQITFKRSGSFQKENAKNSINHCIVIFGGKKEAVCRECLALHSKWLSIRTYHVFLQSRQSSVDVCVFTSDYKSDFILSKCRHAFCEAIFTLNEEECQKLDKLFPLHAELQKSIHEKAFETQNSLALDDPGVDLQGINGSLHQIAMKRMSKRQWMSNSLKSAWLPEGKLGIGDMKNLHCHNVSSSPKRRSTCINCKLGAAKDRLI